MARLGTGKPSSGATTRSIIAGLSPCRLLLASTLIGFGLWLHGLIGVLLLVIGTDLAMSRQPLPPRPSYWPALGFAAVGMLLVEPYVAIICGWLVMLTYDLTATPLSVTDSAAGSVQRREDIGKSDLGDRL